MSIYAKKGFTLIELILTIGIIGLVGGFAIRQINPLLTLQMNNDSQRKSDLMRVQQAVELYYKDFGKFPQSSGNYEIVDFKTNTPLHWGTQWIPYMKLLPIDTGGRRFAYFASADLQSYWLYASLEAGSADPFACVKGLQCASIIANHIRSDACGIGVVCNLMLSSHNVSQ